MKKIIISFFCIILGLTYCGNRKEKCLPLKQELVSTLLQKEQGDSIMFANNDGQKIAFVIDKKAFTKEPYEMSCEHYGILNNPPCECLAQGFLSAFSFNKKYGYNLVIEQYDNRNISINIQLGGFLIYCFQNNDELVPQKVDSIRIDYKLGNKIYPKYGQAASTNFIMGEGTSRNHMLKYNPESGKWAYLKNDREKSTTQLFRAFNNGAIDVMMINVVASTGGSAQSSPAEGIDTRPRNMFIIQ
jgi:hypothetical protein